MQKTKPPKKPALTIAQAAIMAALVAVTTLLFVIPIPATSGYFNLGETFIYVSALLFGPLVGGNSRRHGRINSRHIMWLRTDLRQEPSQ